MDDSSVSSSQNPLNGADDAIHFLVDESGSSLSQLGEKPEMRSDVPSGNASENTDTNAKQQEQEAERLDAESKKQEAQDSAKLETVEKALSEEKKKTEEEDGVDVNQAADATPVAEISQASEPDFRTEKEFEERYTEDFQNVGILEAMAEVLRHGGKKELAAIATGGIVAIISHRLNMDPVFIKSLPGIMTVAVGMEGAVSKGVSKVMGDTPQVRVVAPALAVGEVAAKVAVTTAVESVQNAMNMSDFAIPGEVMDLDTIKMGALYALHSVREGVGNLFGRNRSFDPQPQTI